MPKLQHIRSATLHKRPDPALLLDGQIAQNQAPQSPGMFFKLADGSLCKIGPIHVGLSAPNVVPAGSAGNSTGEGWLDTSGIRPVLKIWNGFEWIVVSGGGCTVSDTAPTGSVQGDLWFNSLLGVLFIWYEDSDGSQWVEVGGSGSSAVSTTPPASPTPGMLWYRMDVGGMFTYLDDGDSGQWVEI